jgi:hypothetical protein
MKRSREKKKKCVGKLQDEGFKGQEPDSCLGKFNYDDDDVALSQRRSHISNGKKY